MKRIAAVLCLVVAVALAGAAQEAPADPTQVHARTQQPTYSDQYCAGFITSQSVAAENYVAGGVDSPSGTRFGQGDILYLHGNVQRQGAQFTVLRHVQDPNRNEPFPGQRRMVARLGRAYAEMGRVRVVGVQGQNAIAHVEFSCDAIVPGDLVVPFTPKPAIDSRTTATFHRFQIPAARVSGQVVMSRDFGLIASTGNTVYLSVGANQGVSVGDVFRAVRGYHRGNTDDADSLAYFSPVGEPTQAGMPRRIDAGSLPRRILGEMVVLHVTPTSATAMVTLALEEINLGDVVELH